MLRDVSFGLELGKVYALIGTNGSGKTTLFNIITGFMEPDSGSAQFKGMDACNKPAHRINRMGISRSFQDLRLVRELTVLENVLLAFQDQEGEHWWKAMLPAGVYRKEQDKLKKRAKTIIKQTFLTEVIDHKAGEISYGQQKLLTLACCLANDAELLLLDEPVAGINPAYRDKIAKLILNIKQSGKTVLLIEHNAEFIERVCDRVFFLNEGSITEFESYGVLRNDQEVREAYV